LLALVLLAISNLAFSDTYSNVVAAEETCKTQGELALHMYNMKEGDPVKFSKDFFIDNINNPPAKGYRRHEMNQYTVEYVFTKAFSDRDAYMQSWAHCMDLLR
jgi:hypothetical protein